MVALHFHLLTFYGNFSIFKLTSLRIYAQTWLHISLAYINKVQVFTALLDG
jgi:hypothetical protein